MSGSGGTLHRKSRRRQGCWRHREAEGEDDGVGAEARNTRHGPYFTKQRHAQAALTLRTASAPRVLLHNTRRVHRPYAPPLARSALSCATGVLAPSASARLLSPALIRPLELGPRREDQSTEVEATFTNTSPALESRDSILTSTRGSSAEPSHRVPDVHTVHTVL